VLSLSETALQVKVLEYLSSRPLKALKNNILLSEKQKKRRKK